MSKPTYIVPLLIAVSCLSSCQYMMSPAAKRAAAAPQAATTTKNTAARSFERNDPTVPFLAVRIYYGDAANLKSLIEVQDDQAERYRGMRRVGDGILSVGIKDEKGRWLASYECGGHLFVTGAAGQPCQVVLRNESNSRLEIVTGIDSRDAVGGGGFKIENQGIILQPMQTSVIGQNNPGAPDALRFGPGRPASAGPVIEREMKPSNGSLFVAVFHEKDRFPWEGTSRPVRKNSPGKFPQRQYEPEPLTFEYR